MIHSLKRRLYFMVAAYFAFWAGIVLRRWRPRIVVVTGSSGKTTVLHLIEAQLGDKAVYSHHANSAIGIPLHILGMPPNVPSRAAWLKFLLSAPLHAWRRPPATKLYVVEADCDRPHEGAFTSKLLKPEVTLWVSVSRTHSMNFDGLVRSGQFETHLSAIAHEFGYFIEATNKLVVINGDQPDMIAQTKRVKTGVVLKQEHLGAITDYRLTTTETVFVSNGKDIHVPGLQPKAVGIGLQMVNELLVYLDQPFDPEYYGLRLPPGRSAVLKGKNNVTLIDSTYNTGLDATAALLGLFADYPATQKWLVLGDIMEQGSIEKAEHERLAKLINASLFDQVVLLGPRIKKYTYPLLKNDKIVVFENSIDGLQYLKQNLRGGEAILFKGARGMEGIIEQLLVDPADADKLVRRGPIWTKRRQQWGLPR